MVIAGGVEDYGVEMLCSRLSLDDLSAITSNLAAAADGASAGKRRKFVEVCSIDARLPSSSQRSFPVLILPLSIHPSAKLNRIELQQCDTPNHVVARHFGPSNNRTAQ